jgi:hypothetical protein
LIGTIRKRSGTKISPVVAAAGITTLFPEDRSTPDWASR